MTGRKRPRVLVLGNWDRPGNHMPKILEAMRRNAAQSGGVRHVSVMHDNWCSMLAGRGPCDCDPDVEILGREQ